MAEVLKGLRYSPTHEWVDAQGASRKVGLTDHAQKELSDIVYVELPEVGRALIKGQASAVVESCKAASDIFAPLSGVVVAVNSELEDHPELINQSPYFDGWLFSIEVSDESEINELLDFEEYEVIIT